MKDILLFEEYKKYLYNIHRKYIFDCLHDNKFYKRLKLSYKSCLFVDIVDKPHINTASHSTSLAIPTDHSSHNKRHDRHNSTPKQLSTSSRSIDEIIHPEHGSKQPSDTAERKSYYCVVS
jgi:hypothetical protein